MNHEPDENETNVRAALRRLGVRPAGHDADDEQQPVPAPVAAPPEPTYPPAAAVPRPRPSGAPHLPDWRMVRKPDLPAAGTHEKPPSAPPTDPVDPEEPQVDKTEKEDLSEGEGKSKRPERWRLSPRKAPESAAPPPGDGRNDALVEEPVHPQLVVQAPPAPAAPPATGARRLLPRRIRDSKAWMFLLFNGTAAAAGWQIGLNMYLSQFPQNAVIAAGGLLGLVGAFGAGGAAWKVVTVRGVAEIVPYGFLGQAGITLLAAEVGRRTGEHLLPAVAAAIHAHTGLDAQQVALLIVDVAVCGATGFLVWKTRAKTLPVRWFSRIPLATAVTACALYAS